jgi:hypothetical protein
VTRTYTPAERFKAQGIVFSSALSSNTVLRFLPVFSSALSSSTVLEFAEG